MASKITGTQLVYRDDAPLIDVDTAITDLAEDLQREGRHRQLAALQYLSNLAATHEARNERDWHVLESDRDENGNLVKREVDTVNRATNVIVLKPIEED